LEFNVPF